MIDRFGLAVVEERHSNRRMAALEDYLRTEYGSTSGTERYIAEANHTSSPRSGVRTFLAKIAGAVVRARPQPATPAVTTGQALSGDRAEHGSVAAPVTPAPAAHPVGYRGRLNVRLRAVLPPLKR